MHDDDFITLDARIDGLREAIAAIVGSLHDNSPAVAALQALQIRMQQQPTHQDAKKQVEQLIETATKPDRQRDGLNHEAAR